MNAVILFIMFLQDSTKAIPFLPVVPSGFNYWYIGLFAAGMFVHFITHLVKAAGGWSKITTIFNSSFFDNIVSWFGNKFHLTMVSGAAAAIIGTAAQWGLNVPFATLNSLGIAIAVASGYIGDSMFNGGGVATPANSVPLAQVTTLPAVPTPGGVVAPPVPPAPGV